MPPRSPMLKRLINKIYFSEGGCWKFIGSKQSDGYGTITRTTLGKRKVFLAHRVTYRAFKGIIPKGLEIDHLCRVRSCVNPEHLEAVTHTENIHRGEALKRWLEYAAKRTHCMRGHEFTEENTYLHKRKGGFSRECKTCILKRETQRRLKND